MFDIRRSGIIVGTLFIAFATGHVMQHGWAFAERSDDAAQPVETSVLSIVPMLQPAAVVADVGAIDLPRDLALPQFPDSLFTGVAYDVAALDAAPDTAGLMDAAVPAPFFAGCPAALTVSAEPGAMIRASLTAPCFPNTIVTVSHAGLRFGDVTDNDGHLNVSLPALSRDGIVMTDLTGGPSAEASTPVLTLDGYARSGIQWQGPDALRVHAFEYGALFGGSGHIWADAPATPLRGVQAAGGFLTRLGNPDLPQPMMAEIYSFPIDRIPLDGQVDLQIEAEISTAACGHDINGTTIELGADGALAQKNVTLSLPTCDDAGGYIVLKNLLETLTIARN